MLKAGRRRTRRTCRRSNPIPLGSTEDKGSSLIYLRIQTEQLNCSWTENTIRSYSFELSLSWIFTDLTDVKCTSLYRLTNTIISFVVKWYIDVISYVTGDGFGTLNIEPSNLPVVPTVKILTEHPYQKNYCDLAASRATMYGPELPQRAHISLPDVKGRKETKNPQETFL